MWAAAGLLALTLLLAWAIRAGLASEVDAAVLRRLGLWVERSPGLGSLAEAFTRLGNAATRIAIALVGSLALLIGRWRAEAVFLPGAVMLGGGVNSLLKLGFARGRPEILPQLDVVHSLSFPSGHAANAVVLWVALAVVVRRLAGGGRAVMALAGVIAFLIGGSRVALAVHWPSDVVAGWCVGLAWVLICIELLERWQPRLR